MASTKTAFEIVKEDDFVEYFLFPVGYDINNDSSLEEVTKRVNTIVNKYASSYIWQKDQFNVIPRNIAGLPLLVDNEESLPPHLYGTLHYGENIEDEWFLVFLLQQLTKEISGLVVRVVDSDGEFLLIEAANFLPKWASPENCDQRVYIYEGSVHLIPLANIEEEDDEEDDAITVAQAIERVRSDSASTKAADVIQNAINKRIEGYPSKIEDDLHRANVYVPVGVAALLKERPSLIAPAVIGFCHRDPIDVRVCRAMRYFPPETRVMTSVTFTKCLYAMLLQQKFVPDRRTGWNLPPQSSSTFQAHSLGMKIDLLEGSQEYNKLEKIAKDYYRSHTTSYQPSIGQIVLRLLDTIEYDVEEMKKAEKHLPTSDDDSWLQVSVEDLDRLMAERYGGKQAARSMEVSSHLSTFLKHVSTHEGAEFPSLNGECSSGAGAGGAGSGAVAMETEADDEDSARVNFDQDAFSCAVQNILDFVVPEDSWDLDSDGSGMSSYEDEAEMDLGKRKTDAKSETPITELKQYMDQMDRELSTTTLGQSFEKKVVNKAKKGMEDSFSDIENFEPVDIDMNALKNILESYQAEMGGSGPASNLLGPMGVKLDKK
ncbi:hypothetical protein LSTR_LSTR007464 [Laodelphax striatellus]|uniref:Uncharacterized protein n=1 Tax=Laodelphax striatellus TaxID=195883 RepID=A0A482X397_LAOST|nr:hypothetical protein LSTR_LSTR007464 [Laodelphax striatellus]